MMANKDNARKKQDINVQRAVRKKKKKKNSAVRFIITLLALIIIGVAVFVTTIKVMNPDFDFSSLIADGVCEFVSKGIADKMPSEIMTQEQTTVATTKSMLDYLESEEFKFNTSRQGNFIGNLLGGGKVGTDMTYIYYAVEGDGIYRFNPNTESYSLFYAQKETISCLNLRGDYIYFINEGDNSLCKLQKGKNNPRKIAENVKFAYVYDSNVYFITTENALCTMDVKDLVPCTIYYSADERLDFIGISLERVFFSVTGNDGTVDYLTVDNYAHNNYSYFRDSSYSGEILSMEMENGFMYYYKLQTDGTYDLCRQKFGSKNAVTLLENATTTQYAVVDSNRLYYSDLDGNKFRMKELNMNSGDRKTLLKVSNVENSDLPSIQHGGEYDFIIGAGKYSASCIYTSSTNVMSLNDNNKWKY